jgi:hypothetical protein
MTLSTERLSPILVKELRQGIRSHLFTGSFLLVQGLLLIFGLSFLLSDGLQKDATLGAALFWTMLVLPLVVLVPASASQAIGKEITDRTLELLLLTRLTSYRIVLGKWTSVLVQTTLVLVSALPYVILRYFIGGVDVWFELRLLLLLLVASALLAGIAMGFWALNLNRWAKWAVVILVLWTSPVLIFSVVSPGGLPIPTEIGAVGWVYGSLVMLMMLESAAARIGPPAENHTSRVRLLALAGLSASFLFAFEAGVVALIVAVVIVVPVVVWSLNQKTLPLARLYEPFRRGPFLKRLVAFPFCPSWPGGAAFTVLVLALAPVHPALRSDMGLFAWSAVAALVFLPAALAHGLFRRPRPLGLYLFFLILSSLPLYVYGFAQTTGMTRLVGRLQSLAGLFPPLALVVEVSHPVGYPEASLARPTAIAVAVLSVVVVVALARREWASIEELCRDPESREAVRRPDASVADTSLGPVEEGAAP